MWPFAIATGAVCGFGVFFLIREFLPTRPSLQGVVDRLMSQEQPVALDVEPGSTALIERAGTWVSTRVPVRVLALAGPTRADLDLIGRPVTSHYGEKALSALVGLIAVPVLAVGLALVGLAMPTVIPAGVGVALAIGAWFLPDMAAKSRARAARATFRRAVSTYLELLAIERASGTGVNQATVAAAEVAKSWPFKRILQALELARWHGQTPWAALRALAGTTGVVELADVADILEQAGREGSAIHDQLESRAAAMRDAQLDAEQQIAHDATVRMTIPGTLTVLVYFLALLIPAMMSMFSASSQ